MISKSRKLLCAVLLSASLAAGAQAATIVPNGIVLVNKGNGFVRIDVPTEAIPGDMIMINEGNAQITYRSGVVAQLLPGQVYTIGNEDNAAGGALHGAEAAGGIGGMSTTAVVIGGIAIVGGAAAIIAASSGDKKSSSP